MQTAKTTPQIIAQKIRQHIPTQVKVGQAAALTGPGSAMSIYFHVGLALRRAQ
jgi:hypothetical protein